MKALTLHPCFSETAHSKYGRIHLPVAPKCNLGCNYCERLIGGPSYHSYRPAICTEIITPEQALEAVSSLRDRGELKVVGVAGPGEPLYNEETFEALGLVHRRFEELILCTSTNGLLLPSRLADLLRVGVSTLTVTVNTTRVSTAEKLYDHAILGGERVSGREAAEAVVHSQLKGIRMATKSGLLVKANTILIPELNAHEVEEIAARCREAGACIQNITPLIPLGRMRSARRPSCDELREARRLAGDYLEQFTLCRQCRADSVGLPGGEDGTLTCVPREGARGF